MKSKNKCWPLSWLREKNHTNMQSNTDIKAALTTQSRYALFGEMHRNAKSHAPRSYCSKVTPLKMILKWIETPFYYGLGEIIW